MKQVIAVYDAKAEIFTQPVFTVAIGEAVRSFQDEVNNPQSQFSKHPEDYTLFHLGTYDETSAKFDLLTAPVSLGAALNFVQQ